MKPNFPGLYLQTRVYIVKKIEENKDIWCVLAVASVRNELKKNVFVNCLVLS